MAWMTICRMDELTEGRGILHALNRCRRFLQRGQPRVMDENRSTCRLSPLRRRGRWQLTVPRRGRIWAFSLATGWLRLHGCQGSRKYPRIDASRRGDASRGRRAARMTVNARRHRLPPEELHKEQCARTS